MARFRSILPAAWALCCACALPAAAADWAMAGTKAIVVTTRDGERLRIGSVQFTPAAGGDTAFKVTMDAPPFGDHFLSMREFKCLAGSSELLCHVPYPYPNPGTVAPGRLAWLEHSLMFFFKLPADFGAKLWNGLYFELRPGDAGLVGRPQAIDLNLIASPPRDPATPPYRPALRDEITPGLRWVRSLSIE